jgi:hypothetical protein
MCLTTDVNVSDYLEDAFSQALVGARRARLSSNPIVVDGLSHARISVRAESVRAFLARERRSSRRCRAYLACRRTKSSTATSSTTTSPAMMSVMIELSGFKESGARRRAVEARRMPIRQLSDIAGLDPIGPSDAVSGSDAAIAARIVRP